MYRPLKVLGSLGMSIAALGVILGIRFLVYMFLGDSGGHIQSLLLAVLLIMLGVQTFISGMQADIIAANRKILEDVQYRVRKMECEPGNSGIDNTTSD
jgi:hypothetical protein